MGVKAHLAPFLPVPVIEREVDADGTAALPAQQRPARSRSAGCAAFFGNVGLLLRAYTYVRSMGPDGLRQASRDAVLNANYLQGAARTRPSRCRSAATACTSSCSRAGGRSGRACSTLDMAKRLIDYGYHPPTIYFPLVVDECMMIEPTETEDRDTLDAFAAALLAIAREAEEDRSGAQAPADHAGYAASTRRARRASRTCAGAVSGIATLLLPVAETTAALKKG